MQRFLYTCAVLLTLSGLVRAEEYGYGYNFNAALSVVGQDGTLTTRCGAALVTPGMAVTAAHCLDNLQLDQLRLAFDRSDMAGARTNSPYVLSVKRVEVHPSYTQGNVVRNDIALIFLNQCLNSVQPALLNAAPDRDGAGQQVMALGWGSLDCSVDKPVPNTQLKILPAVTDSLRNSKCEASSEGTPDVVAMTLCITPTDKNIASPPMCGADAGAPVVGKTQKGQYVLLGVVSHAQLSGQVAATRVSSYASWIETMMTQDLCLASSKFSDFFLAAPQTSGTNTGALESASKDDNGAEFGVPAVPKANGDGSTCENFGKSCPFAAAVCCTKSAHCCPQGYYCQHYSTTTLCVPGAPPKKIPVVQAPAATDAPAPAAAVDPKTNPLGAVASVYDDLQKQKATLDQIIASQPNTVAAQQAVATEAEMRKKFEDIPA